ncbi:MAG: CDP-diacylglycerol--glycerol-3-phosphate 3-phosphatidyltransferase [Desulfobacterales bacterium]|nr:CDP-diacylglycerol--glycerol-3-phosphate 3-phosphatidyltransferase [Desulfobacterales bacterium]
MATFQNLIRGPNLLTLFRIAAVPIIIILMLFPNRFSVFMAALVFSAAAITDYLDGFYARKRNMVTTLGKVMDPVADKLLVSSSFIMLAALDWVPAWMACIIIGRELAVTGLRNIIAEKGEDLSASNLGKFKTGFQIAAIIPLMIHFPFLGLNVQAIGHLFLWGALVFTIWSGADYFIRSRSLLES